MGCCQARCDPLEANFALWEMSAVLSIKEAARSGLQIAAVWPRRMRVMPITPASNAVMPASGDPVRWAAPWKR